MKTFYTSGEWRVASGKRMPVCIVTLLFLCQFALAGSDPYRGLWVGQANLNFVNEVSVPLDENNVAVAPDPKVPTPTADQAQIRLILHVNGAGQVNLLKDVAIMSRSEEGETNLYFASEADLVLVTDESLYSDFPEQTARRITSVVFDFGDAKATEAIDEIIRCVSDAVSASMWSNKTANAAINETAAEAAGVSAAASIVAYADVAESFDAFLKEHLPREVVTAIASTNNPVAAIENLRAAAGSVVNQSFYLDTRATDVLDALEKTLTNDFSSASLESKVAAAQNVAARFADVDNLYKRYVSGVVFGDMIREVALACATKVAEASVTLDAIDSAARAVPVFAQAEADALNAKIGAYADTASVDALERVVSNIVYSAYGKSGTDVLVLSLASELEALGFATLATLQQNELSVQIPTSGYTEFVRSSDFSGAVSIAADAAAAAAMAETEADSFYTQDSLEAKAVIGATSALNSLYLSAAKVRKTELPLAGKFAQGSGDPRLVSMIESGGTPLGAAGLIGTIVLPANHPTNPFRHRRHPDHTVGFDIERRLRFDFDGVSTNALDKTGLGVERITGIYREEVFGLHKPLGPDPSLSPVGVKVEGSFELSRISLIDTLNAR